MKESAVRSVESTVVGRNGTISVSFSASSPDDALPVSYESV